MTKPDRNPIIEAMAERYWNAYQAGITAAGLRGYPKWHESTDPVKEETRRCMRHAVEAIKKQFAEFEELFPDKPQRRRLKPIPNDQMQAVSAQIARMGE